MAKISVFLSVTAFGFGSILLQANPPAQQGKASPDTPSAIERAFQKLDLPHITLNASKMSVDIEAKFCLNRGPLEMVVCLEGTKEHESLLSTRATPSHIHACLLLLKAKPGSPARKARLAPEDGGGWVDVPPSGSRVGVSVVLTDSEGQEVELPLSRFVKRNVDRDSIAQLSAVFTFAGSVLSGADGDRSRYACDASGHVISLATFGDELLCLPGIHDKSNHALLWEIDPSSTPEKGSVAMLRLRPR